VLISKLALFGALVFAWMKARKSAREAREARAAREAAATLPAAASRETAPEPVRRAA
jgi:hypothetical protein